MDCCGRVWTAMAMEAFRSRLCGLRWTPTDARLEIYGSEGIRACANAAIAPSMTNTGKIIPDVMPSSVRITPCGHENAARATSNGNTRYKVWKGYAALLSELGQSQHSVIPPGCSLSTSTSTAAARLCHTNRLDPLPSRRSTVSTMDSLTARRRATTPVRYGHRWPSAHRIGRLRRLRVLRRR